MSWSKNVTDERTCPAQIILGADDTDFCTLLALACYLESRLTDGTQGKYLFGERDDEDEPARVNDWYQRTLKNAWNNPDFQQLQAQITGLLGTHSIRKFPATYACECGCRKDETEIRGRWKAKESGRTVNVYINPEQLPTEGKMERKKKKKRSVGHGAVPRQHLSRQNPKVVGPLCA